MQRHPYKCQFWRKDIDEPYSIKKYTKNIVLEEESSAKLINIICGKITKIMKWNKTEKPFSLQDKEKTDQTDNFKEPSYVTDKRTA